MLWAPIFANQQIEEPQWPKSSKNSNYSRSNRWVWEIWAGSRTQPYNLGCRRIGKESWFQCGWRVNLPDSPWVFLIFGLFLQMFQSDAVWKWGGDPKKLPFLWPFGRRWWQMTNHRLLGMPYSHTNQSGLVGGSYRNPWRQLGSRILGKIRPGKMVLESWGK